MTHVAHQTSGTPLHIARFAPTTPHPRRFRAQHALAAMLLSLLGVGAVASLEEDLDAAATVATRDPAAR